MRLKGKIARGGKMNEAKNHHISKISKIQINVLLQDNEWPNNRDIEKISNGQIISTLFS
jgi:hypothetical protein